MRSQSDVHALVMLIYANEIIEGLRRLWVGLGQEMDKDQELGFSYVKFEVLI